MDRTEVEAQVRALGRWFHNLDLGGVRTAPDHFLGDFPRVLWQGLAPRLPDVRGKTVLDVGCNGGFYCVELARLGAARVVGIDHDPRYLEQARLATRVSGVPVELRELDVYDVGTLREKFDLVFFMGVLYHLRHPLLALDLLREHVVGGTLVFQSMTRGSRAVVDPPEDLPFEADEVFDRPGFPRMGFVERAMAGDGTNWWVPNRAGVEALLRSAGFTVYDALPPEVYLCRPDRPAAGGVYPAR